MSDTLSPSPALLAKLGSIIVHADEYLSVDGHPFDRDALQALLRDEDVVHWLQQMAFAGMVPLRRKRPSATMHKRKP